MKAHGHKKYINDDVVINKQKEGEWSYDESLYTQQTQKKRKECITQQISCVFYQNTPHIHICIHLVKMLFDDDDLFYIYISYTHSAGYWRCETLLG